MGGGMGAKGGGGGFSNLKNSLRQNACRRSPIAATPTGLRPRTGRRAPSGSIIYGLRPTRAPTVPEKGAPALMGAGMLGGRADVIFASAEEISGFVRNQFGAR